MTGAPVALLIQISLPRPLTDCFATPADLKAYLLAHRLWPEGHHVERWRLNDATPGQVVEIEVRLPLPLAPAQGGTHAG